jgi:hypothetical protein
MAMSIFIYVVLESFLFLTGVGIPSAEFEIAHRLVCTCEFNKVLSRKCCKNRRVESNEKGRPDKGRDDDRREVVGEH